VKLPLYVLGFALSLLLLVTSFRNPDTPEAPAEPSPREAAMSPLQSVEAYIAAAREGALLRDPGLYTEASAAMLQERNVTATQRANAVTSYDACRPDLEGVYFDTDRRRAVIRYRIEARTCHPWFLAREEFDDRWRLDLEAMGRYIRFNRRNYWHLSTPDMPYFFGLKDLAFDANGYPFGGHGW